MSATDTDLDPVIDTRLISSRSMTSLSTFDAEDWTIRSEAMIQKCKGL